MNRRLLILEFALASLLRHRARVIVTIAVFALTVFLWSSLLMLSGGLKREARAVLSGAPELVVQRISGGRQVIAPAAWAETIAGVRGVRGVRQRVWGYYYDPPTGANYTVIGSDGPKDLDLALAEGEFYGPDDARGCVIGRGVAEARIAEPGDIIPMKLSDGGVIAPRVTGVFDAESALLTNDLLVMPTAAARDLFAVPDDCCTDLLVEVGNPREIDTITLKIQELLPEARPLSRDRVLATYDAVFDWRAGVTGVGVALCTLSFLILAWNQAAGLAGDQRRTIGVMKACGWRTGEVLESKLWESAAVSLLAVLLGLAAAWAHLLWAGGRLFAGVMKGWSVMMPAFAVRPLLEPYQFLLLLALTVAPYLAATLVPSWRAAATDPMTAMKG